MSLREDIFRWYVCLLKFQKEIRNIKDPAAKFRATQRDQSFKRIIFFSKFSLTGAIDTITEKMIDLKKFLQRPIRRLTCYRAN